MEPTTQNQSSLGASNTVPGANVPQLRNDRSVHDQSQMVNPVGTGSTIQGLHSLPDDSEAERQARAEIETGNSTAFRLTGRQARNPQHARAFARYDPQVRTVQPVEFYRYSDREVNTYGYI